MGESVLVTGGCGFIGSHLVRALVETGARVRVLDDLSSGKRENLDGVLERVELLRDDLRDPAACKRAVQGTSTVFHQGAVPSVPRSVAEPERTFQVNVAGSHQLFLAAREAKVRRLVMASSSSVYGDQPTLPKHEDMAPQPASPYAAHKLAMEQLGMAFSRSLGLECVALRYFNVYGPRQDPTSAYAAVVPAFAAHLLQGEPPLIHGDGQQTRDFTWVGDVVRANVLAARAPRAAGEVMNVAGGRRISILELYRLIAQAVGRPELAARHGPPRAGDVRDSLASIDKAERLLGWRPEMTLAEGIRLTVEALRRTRPA